MPLALSKIKPCFEDDLADKTNSFTADQKFTLDFHGELVQLNAEKAFPHLLTDEYIGDVCYNSTGSKKEYRFTDKAWGQLQKALTARREAFNAGSAREETDVLEALRGKEEPVDVPLEAFGVDAAAAAVMAHDEPPLIDAGYDTHDWRAVPYYLPPDFIAALRAALGDTENKLFRRTDADGIYYVTKKINKKLSFYPSDARELARIVNELSEVKAWFERKAAKDTNAPKEALEKLARQRDNVLVILNKFEELLREMNQEATEERGTWNMILVFCFFAQLSGPLLYSIYNSFFKKRRNGNGRVNEMLDTFEGLDRRLQRLEDERFDRFERAMETFLAGLDGGRALTERDMISTDGLEGEALERALRYNKDMEELKEGRKRMLEAREAFLKAREAAGKGEKK